MKLDYIYESFVLERKLHKDKNPIQIVDEILKEQVGDDWNNLLILKAQKRAWEKNTDLSLHYSIAALVISIVTPLISLLESLGCDKALISFLIVIWVIFPLAYAVRVLFFTIKSLEKRQNHEYIIVGLEEYEKKMNTNSDQNSKNNTDNKKQNYEKG